MVRGGLYFLSICSICVYEKGQPPSLEINRSAFDQTYGPLTGQFPLLLVTSHGLQLRSLMWLNRSLDL